jgi:hypothetical protein
MKYSDYGLNEPKLSGEKVSTLREESKLLNSEYLLSKTK